MDHPDWPTGLPSNFGGLEEEFSALARSRAVVLPVPYDFSTTYQGGARWGPSAILSASRNMELWDDELGATYRAGIHTLPEVEPTALGPEAMAARVERRRSWAASTASPPGRCGRPRGASPACRCSTSTPTPTCATATSTRPTATPA
jgi:hypothetical protein